MMKKCMAFLLAVILAASLLPPAQAASESAESYCAYFAAEEWAVLKLVNRERSAQGLDPLTGFDALQDVAGIRAEELVTLFDHIRPDGRSCFTAYDEAGVDYYAAGENIAAGYRDAVSVMEGWMNSPGHRGNILSDSFTSVGLGYRLEADSAYRHHWTQNFQGFPFDFTQFELVTPNGCVLPEGSSFDELDAYLVLKNARDGRDHYLPLTEELVNGFTGSMGTVTVSFDLLGVSGSFDITVRPDFSDVQESDFYYEPVLWAVDHNITTGATATTFNPDGDCLRAQVVTFLYRTAGNPEPATTGSAFTDVQPTDFFYKPVLWAVETGITNGLSLTSFGSYEVCNRAQVVTFLWRAAGSPEPGSTAHPFLDVPAGVFYEDAVLWAVENGITNGMDATHFGPSDPCNRAQVVTFLYRAYH